MASIGPPLGGYIGRPLRLAMVNPTQGVGWIPPPTSFFLVKSLFIDIFTIPFMRIREILLAIRISNKIFGIKGVGTGCLTQSWPKLGRFQTPKMINFIFESVMLIKSSQMTNYVTDNSVTHLLDRI